MSGIIKAASAGAVVRAYTVAPPRRAGNDMSVPTARSETELALDEAHDKISKLQIALIEARELAGKAEKEAREAGMKAGRREARDDIAQRIALIEKGVEQARTAWDDRLAGIDALAVMLARSALAKVFGGGADLADLVTRAIDARMRVLRGESVVGIRVSASDFPDEEALGSLRAHADTRGIDVVADPTLRAGDCRLDLQLGHIDLGIGSHWRELDHFFEALATEQVAA